MGYGVAGIEKRCCWRSTRRRVGLRQEALPQCFLLATTASKVFP
jgi:hypothetical protein